MSINKVQIETLRIEKISFEIGKKKKKERERELIENKFGRREEEKSAYKIRSWVKFPRAGDRVPEKFLRSKRLKDKQYKSQDLSLAPHFPFMCRV